MKKIFHDKNGISVQVNSLEWQQTYLGWLEGGPEYMNKVILTENLPQILAKWPNIPHLVFNDMEKRSLAEVFGDTPGKNQAEGSKKYLPGEMAVAYLTSTWCPDENSDESRLVIAWFQDSSNPFETIAKIISELDWGKHAIGWLD